MFLWFSQGQEKTRLVLNPYCRHTWKETVTFDYLVLPSGNMQGKRPYQEDRCERPLSSGQGQVLFSEDAAVTLWNGLGQRDPRLQWGSEASFLKSVVSQPEES